MEPIELHETMQGMSAAWRAQGLRIGFVPTMGFLHEGHASLMRLARPLCDKLVVSIYVNPTQFAAGEDFTTYPRDLARDQGLCLREGVDIVFVPPNLYDSGHSVFVRETRLSQGLCGKSRPTHFEGVATVVVKLLNIVQPHVAVFGQKDAQQVCIIRKVVADLNLPVEIKVGPIHREADGLAMSSRNAYLNHGERAIALSLSRGLKAVEALFHEQRERRAEVLRNACVSVLHAAGVSQIDYVSVVDPVQLTELVHVDAEALVAVAVYVGRTRLIDNIVLREQRL